MVISEQKPFEEILEMLEDARKVFYMHYDKYIRRVSFLLP